jgi:hypothetical protein
MSKETHRVTTVFPEHLRRVYPNAHATWVHKEVLQRKQKKIQKLVDKQANDPGIWFKDATEREAYLQAQLRELHAIIEGE